jgi:hypothetical protein
VFIKNQFQLQYLIKYKHKKIEESEWKSVNNLRQIIHLINAYQQGLRQTKYAYSSPSSSSSSSSANM